MQMRIVMMQSAWPFQTREMIVSMTLVSTTKAEVFAPIDYVPGPLNAGLLLLCDHASNALPASYGTLGLSHQQFQRHIAYDIGAGAVTRALAKKLNVPALLTCFSRLLIDPNRGADDPTLIMQLSDGAIIPGNAKLDEAERATRIAKFWQPYRTAVDDTLKRMEQAAPLPVVLSIHSFTPLWKTTPRPWHVGLLWDSDPRLAMPLINALEQEPGLIVGDNEPYDGALRGDTLDDCITAQGLAGTLIEIRQDLIADSAGATAWAERLARLLSPILERPDLRHRAFIPSRTGRHLSFTKTD